MGASDQSREGGVAKVVPGLLHHFPSKEQLLVAVLAERDRLDGIRFRLTGFRGLAALDRLVELVQHTR
jgi:AcrR family transcriptional regulator